MLVHVSLATLLALLPSVLLAFPTKPGTCKLTGITEGHGPNAARPCSTCFTLTVTRSTNPPAAASGNTFNVVLNGNNPIKGLQIWVQDSANVIFGSWVTYPPYTAPYTQCGGVNPSSNMLAHSAPQFKKMPLNFVWSDMGYKSSAKTKRYLLDDSLFEGARKGMKEEVQAALEKRTLINPSNAIPPSAIPPPVSGKPTQSSKPPVTQTSVSGASSDPSPTGTTNGTTPSSPPPVDADWNGVMMGLVVVDFSDWFFIQKTPFNSATTTLGKPKGGGNGTAPGGGNTTSGGSQDDNSSGDPDGSSDDSSFFIVDPSAILSKNHMLYVALGLTCAFFASGWGVEVFMGSQERKLRRFAKK